LISEPKGPKSADTILYRLVTDAEEVKVNWKNVREAFTAAYPDIELEYVRFGTTEGTIGVNGMTPDATLTTLDTFTVNSTPFRFERLSESELPAFFKEHGDHYNLCR
jgi:hypothetical protein